MLLDYIIVKTKEKKWNEFRKMQYRKAICATSTSPQTHKFTHTDRYFTKKHHQQQQQHLLRFHTNIQQEKSKKEKE